VLLYLAPAFLVMGIITFYPLAFQTYISFTDFTLKNLRPQFPAPWVGIENYQRIIESTLGIPNFHFVRMVIYNLWWALSNVALHVVIGVGVALLLNAKGLRFKKFWRALYILPVVIPPIIVATVWRNMFDPEYGAINQLLAAVGGFLFRIPPETYQIDWLRSTEDVFPFLPSDISYFIPLAFFALLTANTWLGWPLNSVVATGALQSIPGELYEAAEIDGAGNWQKFRNVTLVYLRPAMVPYAIYGFVITFNLFHLAWFMSNGGPFGRTQQLVTQAFGLVQANLYGLAAAFSVIMFLILLVVTLITNRLARATATFDQ
jgi:arabinogalactan oligomer/maltooligosaccharide transport system permease protein